jgi:hypothetical protein
LAIDIGAAAIDRSLYLTVTWTRIDKNNPANADGTIDTVEIWAYSDLSDCEVATFIDEGSNVLSTRDSETLGSVTSGSKQTFSGLDMDVQTGDYIGIHSSAGNIERDNSGDGYWYAAVDYIPCSSQGFNFTADRSLSFYGMGTEGGGATEKQSSDTGTGADARTSGNPLVAIGGSETGSGVDALPARDIALPDSGAGVDALVSLQTPSAKTSSDTGSGVEVVATQDAVLADSESGSGIEAFIARLLTAAENGYGAEASAVGSGQFKELFSSELGEGADGLTAKIEMPTKGGGMRLWT